MAGRIKQLVVLDIIIFIMIAAFIIAAIATYYYRAETTFGYSYKFARNGTLLDTYTNATSEAISTWDVALNFTTRDVFSAQTRIGVAAIAKAEDNNPHDEVQIIFPTAIPDIPAYYNGHTAAVTIDLVRSDTNPKVFTGSTNMTYRDEGDKCIFIREKAQTVQEVFPLCSEDMQPVIHISSADSKFQFETNKVTISLTYVAAGLTFVALRQMISGFGKRWAYSS